MKIRASRRQKESVEGLDPDRPIMTWVKNDINVFHHNLIIEVAIIAGKYRWQKARKFSSWTILSYLTDIPREKATINNLTKYAIENWTFNENHRAEEAGTIAEFLNLNLPSGQRTLAAISLLAVHITRNAPRNVENHQANIKKFSTWNVGGVHQFLHKGADHFNRMSPAGVGTGRGMF